MPHVKRPCFSLILLAGLVLHGCGESQSASRQAARQAELEREAAARERAAAEREAGRLAALWTYHDVPVDKGRQLSATITSRDNVATDGVTARPVRLVFRDHPAWGRSSYLLLEAGDFACGGRCTVSVTVDGGAPARMAARRPPTDEAIAMFINDALALWRHVRGARQVTIEFPVTAGGTRTATFDVGGLDGAKMPGWDEAAPSASGG